MLWPAPCITACGAFPNALLSTFLVSRPSDFICPTIGSIALRGLIIVWCLINFNLQTNSINFYENENEYLIRNL